jgi:hypothetical protein
MDIVLDLPIAREMAPPLAPKSQSSSQRDSVTRNGLEDGSECSKITQCEFKLHF